ncbi:MAG: hypothetical protein A2Z05_09040 [Chloroflexi bacterium RBG_16_60_22]|nr:MAG: hypothetical protein A2Z05_09040 [Chloroflexi bacterium RBG_16_60_22]
MQIIQTGVLVIGGGGAAARAALEAKLAGADVVLATKGQFGAIGTRGAGATASGNSAASVFATPGWTGPLSDLEKRLAYMAAPSPDQAYTNIIQAGLGMADPQLVRVLIEDAVPTRQRLLDWGATFDEFGMRSHGVPIMAVLATEIRRSGVTVLNRTMIVSLLVRNGECLGAVGIDESNGETLRIRAGATVIGTGGDANLFLHNLNPPDNTGDGYVLGYEAGAELMNLEFKQIFLGTIHPTRNMLTQGLPPHVRLTNGRGKEFLHNYLPEGAYPEECLAQRNGHNPFSTRDNLSRYVDIAMIREVQVGRATEHQGIYLDRTDPQITPMTGPRNEFWLYRGIDFSRPVEIGVCHHCSLGGLRIDTNAETSVKRLYAAGEAAAGPHGADRMGGHMLLASQVFGARAGKHGAAAALKEKRPDIAAGSFRDAEENIKAWRGRKGDLAPSRARGELCKTAYFNLLVIRSQENLTRFLADVKRIEQEMVPRLNVTGPEELLQALELQNLLRLAELEAGVCLRRTESRGPHYREDFPHQDDKSWLQTITVRKVDGKPQMDSVVLDPAWKDKGDASIGYWG